MNMFINNEDYKRFYIENKQCFTEKAWSILNQLVDNEITYMFISDTKENLFDGIVSVDLSERLKKSHLFISVAEYKELDLLLKKKAEVKKTEEVKKTDEIDFSSMICFGAFWLATDKIPDFDISEIPAVTLIGMNIKDVSEFIKMHPDKTVFACDEIKTHNLLIYLQTCDYIGIDFADIENSYQSQADKIRYLTSHKFSDKIEYDDYADAAGIMILRGENTMAEEYEAVIIEIMNNFHDYADYIYNVFNSYDGKFHVMDYIVSHPYHNDGKQYSPNEVDQICQERHRRRIELTGEEQ